MKTKLKIVVSYNRLSENYAVCKLIKTFGVSPSPEDQAVIDYHDKRCKALERLPLA